ncbi:MAG TPA: AMP-binding protein [Bacteroidia bacterium]|nr:AMP-binding protein [Bacteroidia bacterium]
MKNLAFSSSSEIKSFQEAELQKLLKYLQSNSPFYQNLFANNNIDIQKIKTVSDMVHLPVTTKEDLHQSNWDFLCVDKSNIVEYCNTSGTLGNPVTIALTENDLQRLAHNEYLSFLNISATSKDVIHLMLSLDRQFMAGIAYYLGARKLGAGIIRGGPGNFAMHLETISRLEPTVLIAVPSFIVNLIGYASAHAFDLNTSSVKKIVCIGENIRDEDLKENALSKRILKDWNVELFSTYASTEQQTAFTECEHGKGGHHQPELLIFEILDDHNNPLPAGEYGELTITTLGVEGMPLLRYKTGDICKFYDEPCECGRFSFRLSPVLGRKKQLIKYKGTTLYPQTIFNVLNGIENVEDYVIELSRNDLNLDELLITISLKNSNEDSDKKIKQTIQSALRVLPEVRYLETSLIHKMQLQEGKRKVNKFIDNR